MNNLEEEAEFEDEVYDLPPPNFDDCDGDSEVESLPEVAELSTVGETSEAHEFDESSLVTFFGENSATDADSKKPPSIFFERESFKTLHEQGLTEIPNMDFIGISCHTISKQWHARWGSTNYAPMWGENLRSELKALLLCIIKLWSWYLDVANDKDAAAYYKKLVEYNKTVSF